VEEALRPDTPRTHDRLRDSLSPVQRTPG